MAESDQNINFEERYLKEQERLAKLWDAYEEQVDLIKEHEKTERELRSQLEERDTTTENLEELLEEKDKKTRGLEKELIILKKKATKFEPMIEKLETRLEEETDKVRKIFELSEELAEELKVAKDAVKARDSWFTTKFEALQEMWKAIDDRKAILGHDFKNYLDLAEKGILKQVEVTEEVIAKEEEEKKELTREEALEEYSKVEGIDEDLAGKIWDELAKDWNSFFGLKKYELIDKIEEVSAVKADEISRGIKTLKMSRFLKN